MSLKELQKEEVLKMPKELTIKPKYSPGIVEMDFDGLEKQCTEMVGKYASLVIDESQVKEVKKDLAMLRKKKKEVNDQKIAVKKDYMKPFTAFEAGCKNLMAIIDGSISNLDEQVKRYEAEQKELKLEAMKEYWKKNGISDIAFELVFDERLLLVSVKEKEWMDHFDYQVIKHKSDMEIIDGIDDDRKQAFIKQDYLKTFNLAESFQNYKIFENQMMFVDERIKQKHDEEMEIEEALVEELESEEKRTLTYTVTATKAQHGKLRKYLDDNGIDWFPF